MNEVPKFNVHATLQRALDRMMGSMEEAPYSVWLVPERVFSNTETLEVALQKLSVRNLTTHVFDDGLKVEVKRPHFPHAGIIHFAPMYKLEKQLKDIFINDFYVDESVDLTTEERDTFHTIIKNHIKPERAAILKKDFQ